MKRILFTLCAVVALGYAAPAAAQFSSDVPLTGYAWSDNVGWISFNCDQPDYGTNTCGSSNYEVVIEPSGDITGHAWSSHIGWIQFGGLGTSPEGGSSDAQIDLNTGEISGWARACAGAANPDCTGGATSTAGGWSGWVKLADGSTPYEPTASGGTISGFSWGGGPTASSSVIGWISWSGTAGDGSPYGITYTSIPSCNPAPTLQCTSATSYDIVNEWCEPQSSGTCSLGETCTDGVGCAASAPPTGTISINPLAVRPGGTTQVTWSSPAADSCTVEQQNPARSGVVIDTGTLSGSVTSNVVNNVSIFSLQCTNAAYPGGIEVASTTIRIIPTLIET